MNVLVSLVMLVLALAPGVPAQADPADWSLRLRNTLFYTDDVALFSATRRLSLREDPTQPALEDDTSYVNHYFSVEVRAWLTKQVSLETELHYERNNWTSGLIGDDRRGGHEDIFQGELLLVYEPIDRIRLYTGAQQSRRKESFESDSVSNLNLGAGASVFF